MDILIKGMKMPKRGIVVNIYPDGRVTNHFDEFGKTIGKAVPIPPYGRLVDADVLDGLLDDIAKEYPKRPLDSIGGYWIDKFRNMLKDAPTIIESEGE